MKKIEHVKHHFGVMIVLALVAVLSIGLLISGSAATIGSTYSSTNGTYQLIGETENPGGGTYSYATTTYGTANLVVFKQATSFVVWADSSVNDSDASIIAAVQALGSSYANMDYWAVTTSTPSFNMYTVLHAANPSANLNENALDVTITMNTSAHTFQLSKGISHYSLFKYTPNTASLIVDKDVTGTNASTSEEFSITVTFTGTSLGGITNNASLTGTNGIYTFTLSGSDTPVTFSSIPYGSSYTVTESISGAQATAGWSYTSGAVINPVVLSSGDTSDMVTILNAFTPGASLVVDKDVLGTNAPTAEDFSITVTFTGANLGGITNNASLTGTNGVYTLLLSGSDTSVTFSNIPYETSYTVTETVSGAQTAAGWAYTSGQVTAPVLLSDSKTSDTVTIVNTYTEPTASLIIDKSVTGINASASEDFSITVTFTGTNLDGITNNASLTGTNGVYTFLLSGSDTPVTFSDIPYGTSYTVSETVSGDQTTAGWTYTAGAVPQAVVLDSGNPSDMVEIINNFGPTASLVVDKNVTGINASATEEFSITVTFIGTGLGDITNNGGLAIAGDGVYTLALSASDPIVTFSNIPYGTQYTVIETVSGTQVNNGWAYTSGAVVQAATLNAENTFDTVEILNTYTPTATLVIDKNVDGLNASATEDFSITVTFTGANVGSIVNNASLAVASDGVYTLMLSGSDAPVTFSKIPFGTTYTVTEAVSVGQTAAGWAYTSGQVNEPAALNIETPVTVAIVNTYTPTATLVVDKTVVGTNASASEEFSITVTFTGSNLGSIINSAGLNAPSGVYTFPLSASDAPITFSKIPYGTSYTITEAISGGQAAAGWTNATGTVTQAVVLGNENPSDSMIIVNNYGPTASLAVDKNVTGTNPSASEAFSITVTFTGTNLGDITNNASLTGISGVYTFTLSGSDAPVIFSNIPYGTQYTVNELISDTQAALGWAYSSGKAAEPVMLDNENTSDTVAIVNNYTPQTPPPPPVIDNGSLIVAKNISGIGATASEEFTITVQFTGAFGGITNNAGLIGTGGVYTLSLVDGESVTFTSIPFGTTYSVTESLTAAQATNGWTSPSATAGTINNAALVDVTVENVFNGTGVAGDNDTGVAGDTDTLPQTGGTSLTTLLGIMGLALVASGGIIVFIFRKHRYDNNN